MPQSPAESASGIIDNLRQHQRSLLTTVDAWATKQEELLSAHEECLECSLRRCDSLLGYRLHMQKSYSDLDSNELGCGGYHTIPNSSNLTDGLGRSQWCNSLRPTPAGCQVLDDASALTLAETSSQTSHRLVDHEGAPASLSKVLHSDALHLGSISEIKSDDSFKKSTLIAERCSKYVSDVQRNGGTRYKVNKLHTREDFSKHAEAHGSSRLSKRGTADIVETLQERFDRVFAEQQPEELTYMRGLFIGPSFHFFCAVMICMNVAVIAVETEYESNTLSDSEIFENLNMVLTCWFGLEMCLKLYGYRWQYFIGPNSAWNYMDVSLVFASVLDIIFTMNMGGTQNMARSVRVLRMIRLVRNIRLIRYMHFAHDFKKMFMSLCSCMGTLFWAIMMLACVTWSFAVVLVQLVITVRYEMEVETDLQPSKEFLKVRSHFRNTPSAMYCMLQSVTAGLNWGTVSEPLFAVDSLAAALYVFYIMFVIFGVLNVVTGVFVDSALAATEYYRELIVERKKREKESYASHVLNIFKLIDEDESGLVTLDEVERIFNDPQLEEFIHALEVNPTDATMLFKLLDYEGAGMIDAEMFTEGCLKLKGEAKSFDIYCLIYENERSLRTTNKFMVDAHVALHDIREETSNLHNLLSGIRGQGSDLTEVKEFFKSEPSDHCPGLNQGMTLAEAKSVFKSESSGHLSGLDHQDTYVVLARSSAGPGPPETPAQFLLHQENDVVLAGPPATPAQSLLHQDNDIGLAGPAATSAPSLLYQENGVVVARSSTGPGPPATSAPSLLLWAVKPNGHVDS